MAGIRRKVGRPAKTLYAHVRDNSFRQDRHAHLLHGQLLPERAPPWADAHAWARLRHLQQLHQDSPESPSAYIRAVGFADPFGKVVRALHGGRRSYWLTVGR